MMKHNKKLEGSIVPAKAGMPLAAPAGLALHAAEVYAGDTLRHGAPAHLILLPIDAKIVGTQAATELAASRGGELPTHAEFALMFKHLPQHFKPGYYHTSDQAECDGHIVGVVVPYKTDQSNRDFRMRAIRRVPASTGTPTLPPKMLDDATIADIVRRTDGLSTSPYVAPAPAFHFDESELGDEELYAGLVQFGGIFQHLILMPAEARFVTWQQAMTFAAAVGGELPDLDDYEVLLANLRHEFSEEDAYWSRERLDRDQAMSIDFGPEPVREWDSVEWPMRARVVRRVFAGHERSVTFEWHKHIKTAREAAGMTVDRLAELVRVAPDVVERWERGEARTIAGPVLASVCTVLNMDPAWLLGADDE